MQKPLDCGLGSTYSIRKGAPRENRGIRIRLCELVRNGAPNNPMVKALKMPKAKEAIDT